MSDKKTKNNKRRRSRNGFLDMLNALLTLVVLGLFVGGALLYFGTQRFYSEGAQTQEQTFTVISGANLGSVATQLVNQNLISDRWTFQFGALAQRKESSIRAGEYRIAAKASMAEILKEITEGRAITYSVTIPEGFTSWEVVKRINAAPNLVGEITEVPTEGSLLPNTYSFERGADRQSIVERMAATQDELVAQIWAGRAQDLPISTPEEMIILASIVEKETGVAKERPEVAAVFINRLNKGMRLQSDPTIIYGITNGEGPLGRGLRRSEIDEQTPYNTYQIDGLPPGPIANPGIEALKAVANPAVTDAIFFVADGTGGHVFAVTYADPPENVARWRVIER
ncbi:MAG: endolytic transglycosylase MltG, partial [Devosiaceae bacterium]|nr:endolytic transglycosylase MltG [Devosiaceae bacterium]